MIVDFYDFHFLALLWTCGKSTAIAIALAKQQIENTAVAVRKTHQKKNQ